MPHNKERRIFALTERLSAFSIGMSSLEALFEHSELSQDGMRRASPLKGRDPSRSQVERLAFRVLDRKWALTSLHAGRVLAGVALTVSPDYRTRRCDLTRGSLGAFLALSESWLSLYNRYGSDGADQAAVQALMPTALGRLSDSPRVREAVMWYVGLQGVLSYSVAGVAKLFGEEWKNGEAIEGILRTQSYGHKGAWLFLKRHPFLSRSATWAVMAWEISFPIVLLPIPASTKFYSGSALLFHALNSHAMGLGRFFWAFASFHPSIAAISKREEGGLRRDGAEVPRIALGILVTSAAGLCAGAVLRDLNMRSLPMGWVRFPVRSGNSLALQVREGPGSRTILIEGGLAAPVEIYQWFFEQLCRDSEDSVVRYERAGYGASVFARKETWSLDDAVEDLREIIETFAHGDGEVVLVAHSMGGEIARRLVNKYPDALSTLVLIDSTNLNQFVDRKDSPSIVANLDQLFRVQRNKTFLGLGGLMNATPPTLGLPAFVRKRATDAERNHRLWSAAMREYMALLQEVPEGPTNLFRHPVQRHVFAAEATMDVPANRFMQCQLTGELSGTGDVDCAGEDCKVHVVPGAHDTMFTTPTNGIDLARRVLGVIANRST